MAHRHTESPLNPLPPVIIALFVVIVGVEAAFSLGARGLVGGPEAVGWRLEALQRFSFSGNILGWMIDTGQYPPEHLLRFFSYPFVHGNFTHALFAGVMLLALGKMVAEALGPARTLAILAASTFGGALAYGVLLATPVPLIGAFPPIYGLIGAFTYLLWLRLGQVGGQQVRAFSLIGILLGIQLLFGLLFGGGLDWVADLGGFASGFALTILLVPGGWQRLRDRLRQR
ncbi:rhomboid family intramembrane serine protease [Salipiger marinus]|uniref:Rhomboid family protein n=1 Tax=Salipiger marinus TaxID=555512 RepID=A0A1G8Q586_9RHOB|nr:MULTISPECIES: rhomboid family intramembrane serine protease [Salipiger]MCD1619674.1 rhomboid family intramembrane serine protease [Salipiger manganoxidans]MEB3420528.1 rhomboid family intramembrane serine protease [Salipiger manganoxidans]SDI99929.1 Rhomboid family protein [Salipiger marinus]HBM61082.1 rhomboid family intramembrane serine protease [Citreicella sp.]